MSQVLGDEFLLLTAAVDFGLNAIEGLSQSGTCWRTVRHDLGEFWPEEPRVGAGKEQSNLQAGGCDLIAMALGDALQEAV